MKLRVIALAALLLPASASAQQLVESRFRTGAPLRLPTLVRQEQEEEEKKAKPSGTQVVGGYIGAVVMGFIAWRAFDEPAGQHRKVKDDWGYTPAAHIAFGVGSFVGATGAVYGMGRARHAKGRLWGTALGAALPSALILMRHDDPLLPFMAGLFGAPLQGIFGYVGYKMTASD